MPPKYQHTGPPYADRESGPSQYTDDMAMLWNEFAEWVRRRRTEGRWPERQLDRFGVLTVLDVACGTGFHTVELSKAGFKVTAVDGSPAMVEATHRACAENGLDVEVYQINWLDLAEEINEQYDAVAFLGNSLAHASAASRVDVLRNVRACLKPGGILLVDARGYDGMLDHGRPLSGTKVFTGPVGGQAISLDESKAVFEYRSPSGQVERLAVTPIRLAALLADLRDAGFGTIEEFGDFREEFELADVDFVSLVARNDADGDQPATTPARPSGPAPPATSLPAIVVDVDGPLRNGTDAVPGALDAIKQLKAAGHAIVALSNATSKSAAELCRELRRMGFPFEPHEVITAGTMTASYLKTHHPGSRVFWLGEGFPFDASDGIGFSLDGEEPDVIVAGGNGPRVTFDRINSALRWLRRGKPLVAMHHNLLWRREKDVVLDIGGVLAALEEAAGVEATIIGKPSPSAFACALGVLGVAPASAVMVGDDVNNDILAAQALGLCGVLVLTGKTTYADLASIPDPIDHVIPSIAHLPHLLASELAPNQLKEIA
jgi:HAD superfamily hydrolase (TIGR01458 family)